MKKILVLGGYGNFGKRICHALVSANIPVIIAGRDHVKAEALFNELKTKFPHNSIETSVLDINNEFNVQLKNLQPNVVINTAGPFQTSDYSVATACIQNKIHYIDLADARNFVTNISSLNQPALANDVLVVSGASTVPGLSSAVIEHYQKEFTEIELLVYGISPGQKTPRGLATVKSILSYLGKPFSSGYDSEKKLYGWQDLYRQYYPDLGNRWMANCEIPDLDIFPKKYAIKSLRFSAGMESSLLHLSMWAFACLVRLGLPLNLSKHTEILLRLSYYFDCFGSTDGGMHMLIKGRNSQGALQEIKWFIIAKQGDGPQIPCVPSIVLAKKLFSNTLGTRGAMPCVGMIIYGGVGRPFNKNI